MKKMVRLFVAAELPEEIRERFALAQEEVRRSRARITLVGTKEMHITLKFIGEVEGSRLPGITDALGEVTATPFTLDLGSVTLNSPRSPRVVWADVHDRGACRDLAAKIESALVPLGIPAEKRRFRPHITIARVRQFHPSLLEEVAAISTSCPGTFIVDRFLLKKSELTTDGPVYTDIREYLL